MIKIKDRKRQRLNRRLKHKEELLDKKNDLGVKEQHLMEKTTMSVQELSAQMGISLPKAYELVKTPGFPTIRIGARILIPIEAYKEWLVRTSINH